MKRRTALLATLALVLAACSRAPQDGPQQDPASAAQAGTAMPARAAEVVPPGDPRIALAAKIPGISPSDLRATPVAGIYEVAHEGDVSYVSADGAYVFSGNLFRVTETGEFPNLTEARRLELRQELFAALPESQMIIFGRADSPHTLTVFTDVDCQWCQHLHAEIADYNRLGIRVRYLAFPRTGPDTASWRKAEAVWCAKDRNAALTAAKSGGRVPDASCDTPVASHFGLGRRIGLSGTPGVVFETGELMPGYLPPAEMLQAIEESRLKSVAAAAAAR